MKSKTFSGRSLRSSLKGSTWILVLLLLGFMVAFPVAELMLIGNQTDEIHRMTFAMICSYLIVPGFLVTMLAAVVNALNEFWYLFSRDKIDFYHSLPVTRSRFFWEKAIRGLVLYLVPYVIMELITMAIAVSKGHGSHPGSGENGSGTFAYVSAAVFRSSGGTGNGGKYSGRYSVIMLCLPLRTGTGHSFMGAGNDVFQNEYGT